MISRDTCHAIHRLWKSMHKELFNFKRLQMKFFNIFVTHLTGNIKRKNQIFYYFEKKLQTFLACV